MGANAGVGANPFRHRKHLLEITRQPGTEHTTVVGMGVGITHLAENLRLTEHQRIEPAGHPHHMAQGILITVLVHRPTQGGIRQLLVTGQPAGKIRRGAFCQAIDFGAITGRQHRHFLHPGLLTQLAQRRVQCRPGQRYPLTQRNIGGGVV